MQQWFTDINVNINKKQRENVRKKDNIRSCLLMPLILSEVIGIREFFKKVGSFKRAYLAPPWFHLPLKAGISSSTCIHKCCTQKMTTAPSSFLYRLEKHGTQLLLFTPSEISARLVVFETQPAPESCAIRENFTYKQTWCHLLLFVYCEMLRISLLIGKKKTEWYSQGVSSNGLFPDCWLTEFGSVLVNLISSSHYFLWPKWSASNPALSYFAGTGQEFLFFNSLSFFCFPSWILPVRWGWAAATITAVSSFPLLRPRRV